MSERDRIGDNATMILFDLALDVALVGLVEKILGVGINSERHPEQIPGV